MCQDVTAFATVLYVVITFLILVVNIYYMFKFRESVENQQRSAQGQLLFQLNHDFFYQEPHKKIIKRLEEDKSLRGDRALPAISDVELDDHLGFLDTLGTFVRERILDRGLVWALFSHYVESAYESPEISEYLKTVQAEDSTIFEDFVWLYNDMKSESHERQKAKLKAL